MPKSGTLAIIARNAFYNTATQKYGITSLEIKRVLLNAGFEGYVYEDEANYCKANCTSDAVPENKKPDSPPVEIKPKIPWSPKIIRDACPVKGCKGYKIHGYYGWACNAGGKRHYLAIRTAGIILGKEATIEEVGARAQLIVKALAKIDTERKTEEELERTSNEERFKETEKI
jgi:hypothetical protein